MISICAAVQVSTVIIGMVGASRSFTALMSSPRTKILWMPPRSCWTMKVDVGLGMSDKILYGCASECIKERIFLY
jgi:hypothetical protein